ncbi:hypothetical protein H5T87_05270 [bacterium]|nr:hypothetical protein [bacterium]
MHRFLPILLISCLIAFTKPLNHPQGIAFSPNGSLLAVSDTDNNRVLLYKKTDTKWQNKAIIDDISKPQGLSWFKNDRLAICEAGKGRIVFYRLSGDAKKAVKETSIEGAGSPVGIAFLKNRLLVVDEKADIIRVYDISAYPKIPSSFKEFGREGSGKGELNHPTDITATDDGLIFVADEGNGRVAIWRYNPAEDSLEPNEIYELTGFWSCKSVLLAKPTQELWVLSSYSGEIKILPLSELAQPQWRIFNGLAYGTQREVSALYSGHRTPQGNPARNSIFSEGKVPPVLALGRLGDMFTPVNSFALSPTGEAIAIARENKIIVLPLDPRLQFQIPTRPTIKASQREAIISWKTTIPGETKLQIKKNGESQWKEFSLSGERVKHDIAIGGLEPATFYLLRIPIPKSYEISDDKESQMLFSFEFAFATSPEEGETTFLRVPVAVIIYTDVIKTDTLTPDAPPAPPISRSYIDYLRREIEVAQLFYWCNSNMKLWIDCDIFLVNKRINIGKDQSGYDGNGFWREKPINDLKEILQLKGKSLDEYPAVVAITCERRWNKDKKRYEFTPSGGGTYGVDSRPGSSHFLGGHDPAWLFVHEFHHQLDSQYAESGYPEYPFNHFSVTPDGFADNFGSHYDGNAWILRHWHYGDLNLWFTNKFGKIVKAQDKDNDGIPDDCPLVPLDEKRFGSNPSKKDSDDDGLDDMGEVLASSWIYETLVWPDDINARAKYILPDPNNPDSDGDGIKDGYDPLPIYACRPTIGTEENKIWFWLDEDTSEVPRPYQVPPLDNPLHSDIYLWHSSEWLNFRFVSNLPIPQVHIQMDCNADGYYVGADNLDVWIHVDWQAEPKTRIVAEVTNASSSEKWPFTDTSLTPPAENMKATAKKLDEKHYEITFSLKRTPKIGLDLAIGEKIGLNIEILAEANSPRWLCLFQPQQLIPLVVE